MRIIVDNPDSGIMYHTLLLLGVPITVHGHRYLLRALDILNQDENAAFSMTKLVYMRIADEYNVTLKQMESAMRFAIEQAWEKGDSNRQEIIFGYSRENGRRPSNSEFLLRISEYIRYSAS